MRVGKTLRCEEIESDIKKKFSFFLCRSFYDEGTERARGGGETTH